MIRNLQRFFRKLEHLCFPALELKTKELLVANNELLRLQLLAQPQFSDPKRLEPFGFSVYSQNDEDGIIQEIFHRIGSRSKIFVEFGAGDGLQNNTAYLLMQGWNGLWIEGNRSCVKKICNVYAKALSSSQLKIENTFITKDNIDCLISKHYTGEIDLLSVDIDGNDYYVWQNIKCVNPRVVIAEYNGKFPPPCTYCMPYNEKHVWDGSDIMGMSLQCATDLAESLGYKLVGTNLSGVNAFFVRKDLVQDLFVCQSTAIHLYNPFRKWMHFSNGHDAKHFLG